jgi:predicted nucleic acid-binding protein
VSYLLDTNVVSDLRRSARRTGRLREWLARQTPESLYISVVTIGEIRQGIEQLRRRDVAQAQVLSRWLDELGRVYADRILPIDHAVANDWGHLRGRRTVPVIDAFLAATARVHDLTLVTRNVSDFVGLDVAVFYP